MQTPDQHFDLRQIQAVMGDVDVDDPSVRAVIIHSLTCTFAQFEQIGREFQTFLPSVEVGAAQEA